MNKTVIALSALMMAGVASAKLPPLSEEAKATAEATKAKTAWSDKVAAYKLCLVQNKVVEHYRKNKPEQAESQATSAAGSASAASAASANGGAAVASAAPASPPTPAATAAAGEQAGATGSPASAPVAPAVSAASAPAASPAIPPCQDPGPYMAQVSTKVGTADAQPVPAAGKKPTASKKKKQKR